MCELTAAVVIFITVSVTVSTKSDNVYVPWLEMTQHAAFNSHFGISNVLFPLKQVLDTIMEVPELDQIKA